MAKKKRHSPTEVAAKLEQARALETEGRTQAEIARSLGISVMTLHRWRKAEPSSLKPISQSARQPTRVPSEPVRTMGISELQLENSRLRQLVTDLLLEKMRLEEEVRAMSAQSGPSKKRRRELAR